MAYFHDNLRYHEDTKVKRAISKDDIDFLKALQKERNTQDNCETADVRTWVIKDRDDTVTEEGHEDYYLLYDSENCNNLDLRDIYDILKALEFETDYYTGELVIENLNFENDVITFTYFGRKSSISKDNNNKDSIAIKGVCVGELISFFNDNFYEIVRVNMIVGWKHQFCFLTQKAAENYLKRKGHNHSKDAHTYCICTYEDPEIAKLMDIIESTDWDSVNTTKITEDKEFVHNTILTACELALKYCNTYAGDDEELPFNEQDIKDIKLLRKLEIERG
ncbi:MAG: hypothetical protein HG450_003090 [Clostridiales bacterium]|nr:hypothetical protein [Clostridiales bacterium]